MGFKFQKHVVCIESLYFYWVQLYSHTDVIFNMRAYAKQLKALVECAGHQSDHTDLPMASTTVYSGTFLFKPPEN